ncbi:MAG: cytochrome c maturation protein CcmE [bacterium]|nr:cytochrome c maturation protein CcmE [bacterium]
MKTKHVYYLIGGLLLVVFAGFSYTEFQGALTPYVPYDVAREAERTVQVAGGLDKGSSSYDEAQGYLRFTLIEAETSETIQVRYDGVKPANFEDAVSIVAIGRFDAEQNEFAAKQLLVKCPSKYQGLESVETKTYG